MDEGDSKMHIIPPPSVSPAALCITFSAMIAILRKVENSLPGSAVFLPFFERLRHAPDDGTGVREELVQMADYLEELYGYPDFGVFLPENHSEDN